MNIKELENSLAAAKMARDKVRDKRFDEISEEVDKLKRQIHEKYREEWDRVTKNLADAEVALRDARDAEAAKGLGALLPIGEVYEEFRTGNPWDRRETATGKIAVVELFRVGDDFVGSNKPNPGDTVLRELKKNGERSKRCHHVFTTFGTNEPCAPWGWRKKK